MIKTLTKIILCVVMATSTTVWAKCDSDLFNPVSDVNWDNMFPMKLLSGITINPTSNKDPSEMQMPPVCNCGDGLGVGTTFWEPAHVVEVVRDAGCSPILGTEILTGKEQLNGIDRDLQTIRHIHWYRYPIFKMLEMFLDFSCLSNFDGFSVGYMSELDPIYLDPEYSLISNPETALFANPLSVLACSADVLTSNLGKPLNSLFWCAGSHGVVYPQSGSILTRKGNAHTGLDFAHRAIFKMTKLLSIGTTIGANAMCQSQYSIKVNKNQFRFNQIKPYARTHGKPISWGMSATQMGINQNDAPIIGNENSAWLVWQAKQCCVSVGL